MNKKKFLTCLQEVILFLMLVSIDQCTKFLAIHTLQENHSKVLIPKVLELHYLKNKGAAFGILDNQQLLFFIIGVILLVVVCYLLWKFPLKKRFVICRIFLVVLASGAVGNMIDRMIHKYVIDYIYLSFIHFPVFNVADIYVTVSTIALILLFLFKYKEDDLSFISFKTRKFRDLDDSE